MSKITQNNKKYAHHSYTCRRRWKVIRNKSTTRLNRKSCTLTLASRKSFINDGNKFQHTQALTSPVYKLSEVSQTKTQINVLLIPLSIYILSEMLANNSHR